MLRNLVWNLAGVILPLFAAAFSAPVLLEELGSERFGLLTLAWTLIGYFSIFDLGFGRSIAKIVSQRLGEDPLADVAPIIWTAIFTAMALGVCGGLAISYWADDLIGMMKLEASLHAEAREALTVLALMLPFVVVSSILAGALEAYHRFDIVNLLRIPAGLINFLAPLAVIPFTQNMAPVVLVLGLCKIGVSLGYLAGCQRIVNGFTDRLAFRSSSFKELLAFGGWITLGNILNPIVAYTDRFLITAFVSVTIVGYYVMPYEVLMRVLVPVVAITAVLFPTFSSEFGNNEKKVRSLYGIALKCVMLTAFPITLFIACFSSELLALWLNNEVADAAKLVTRLFAIGIFLTCLNQVTLTLVQARGHPDWVPKLFLAELPIYLPCLVWAVKEYGIEGAATVWLLRIFVDVIFLFWGTSSSLPFVRTVANQSLPYLLGLLLLFAITLAPQTHEFSILIRLSVLGPLVLASLLLAWKALLTTEEKNILITKLPSKRSI